MAGDASTTKASINKANRGKNAPRIPFRGGLQKTVPKNNRAAPGAQGGRLSKAAGQRMLRLSRTGAMLQKRGKSKTQTKKAAAAKRRKGKK